MLLRSPWHNGGYFTVLICSFGLYHGYERFYLQRKSHCLAYRQLVLKLVSCKQLQNAHTQNLQVSLYLHIIFTCLRIFQEQSDQGLHFFQFLHALLDALLSCKTKVKILVIILHLPIFRFFSLI